MPGHPVTGLIVTAGHGTASAGLWLRRRSAPEQLFLATVAHVLIGPNRRLRCPVNVTGVKADVFATVPLSAGQTFRADAALLAMPSDFTRVAFVPAAGHLNRFYKDLAVMCIDQAGRIFHGRLAVKDWTGRLRYTFGPRHLTQQWLIRTDGSEDSDRAGHSGNLWMTADRVAVGIQVGVLQRRSHMIITTPVETVCELFQVAAAA
jgi:hypothetical protein